MRTASVVVNDTHISGVCPHCGRPFRSNRSPYIDAGLRNGDIYAAHVEGRSVLHIDALPTGYGRPYHVFSMVANEEGERR